MHPYRFLCRGWRPVLARTLAWLVLAVMTGISLGQIHHEGDVRERQLCGVVINVHANAKFRANTEAQNLQSTLEYLNDPASRESKALYERVKANLSTAYDRLIVANRAVLATEPPPICED